MQLAGIVSGFILLVLGLMGFGKFMAKPVPFLLKLGLKAVIALGVLCVFNLLGDYIGFHFPINYFTVGIVTLFQLPGLITIGILNFLLI